MLNRIKQFMIGQYFGEQLPLDHRIYMIFFFESFFLSIVSATTNTMLNKGFPGLVLQWSYVAFCATLLFVIPRVRLALQKPHLLFVTFIYIPFLYFQTAGYHGTALLFASLGFFLLGIVFRGKARIVVIALNILDYLTCIIISHLYPQMVVPHSGPAAMLIDLIVAMILTSVGLSILTGYISKMFEDNRKTLADLSLRDALTGIYNRRFMTDFLQDSLDTSKRTAAAFYLLMLDIDHFKKINDTYGHGFGDHILLTCAQAIQGMLRKGDFVARYGGEEFVVVLFTCTSAEAVEIAQRIRQTISSLRFQHNVTLTVSIGVEKSRVDDTTEALLDRADQCMYCAKQAGRDQIAVGSMVDVR